MEPERIDSIKTIIGQIDAISDAVNGHLEAVRQDADEEEGEDAAQRLEFAFAELRAARRELTEATKYVLEYV